MEAAGLILPLIVTAAGNFNKLFLTPLHRYRNFAGKAGRYILQLQTQHVSFQTTGIYLLAHVTVEDLASAIIDAPNERAAEDMERVGERLEEIASTSRDTLIWTLQALNSVLPKILKDIDRLSSTVKVEDEATKQRDKLRPLSKAWKYHLGQKLKFSFSGSQQSENLEALTQLVQNFKTLSESVSKLPRLNIDIISGTHSNQRLGLGHRAIGEAAEAIRAALDKLSCNNEETHLAELCVGNEEVVRNNQGRSKVEFEAAFHCPTSCCNFLHFSVSGSMVDDSFRDSVIRQDKLKSLLSSTLGVDEDSSKDLEQTPEPCATFETRRSISLENIAAEQGSNQSREPVLDGAVCEFLSRSVQGFSDGGFFVKASLAHDRGREAGVPMTRTSECPMKSETISLSALLDLPPGATRRMPIPKRFWLAKTLVTAFFRYRHTYWAAPGWESRGICFHTCDAVDACQSSNVHQPWLRYSVRDSTPSTGYGIGSRSGLGRNARDLFALGAMLIEIGYSMNWESLNATDQNVTDDALNSFHQARLLLNRLEMGSTYRNVVEKLIEGIFANGYDLENQKSRGLFVKEIIWPLEDAESKLRDL